VQRTQLQITKFLILACIMLFISGTV